MPAFQPLLPGLTAQFLIGWAVVALFTPAKNQGHVLRPLATALIMLVLSLGIETFLRPFLFQGTVVLQWALFVMLGHRICAIPLGKSILTQICFFSLMLGQGLLEAQRPKAEVRDEERALLEGRSAEPAPEAEAVSLWAARLNETLLSRRMMEIRGDVHILLYGLPEELPAPALAAATPVPPVNPLPAPDASHMTGAEFEALIYTAPPANVANLPEDPPLPGPGASIGMPAVEEPESFEVLGSPTSITPGQAGDITEVRNRSTDRSYSAPDFDIGAVSLGENGRFAMVDGRLMREGAILRTGGSDPRGWKLFKVTPGELFWQPLK